MSHLKTQGCIAQGFMKPQALLRAVDHQAAPQLSSHISEVLTNNQAPCNGLCIAVRWILRGTAQGLSSIGLWDLSSAFISSQGPMRCDWDVDPMHWVHELEPNTQPKAVQPCTPGLRVQVNQSLSSNHEHSHSALHVHTREIPEFLKAVHCFGATIIYLNSMQCNDYQGLENNETAD